MKVLVGDIGATKTDLAIYANHRASEPLVEARFFNQNYSSIAEILETFLSQSHAVGPLNVGLAVAGNLHGGAVKMTNIPWTIEAAALKAQFSWTQVEILNDLEALAYGVLTLKKGDFETLQVGVAQSDANQAVIAAGTGLGEAGLFWDGEKYHPIVGEGGLCNFSPTGLDDIIFLQHLLEQKPYVVVEDFISGRGLERLYSYLHGGEKKAQAITSEALEGKAPALEAAFSFLSLYGAQAGNLALRYLARGGVFIGGGIAQKMLPLMHNEAFIQGFSNHRGLSDILKDIPVHVITQPRACLQGVLSYLCQRSNEMGADGF